MPNLELRHRLDGATEFPYIPVLVGASLENVPSGFRHFVRAARKGFAKVADEVIDLLGTLTKRWNFYLHFP